MFVPNHLHLLVRGYVETPPRSKHILNKFFVSLVSKVRMSIVAGPTSVYVDEPGNEGITGTVTLATSHAAIHVWDSVEPPMFQFDLYSCTEFTPHEVLDEINNHFKMISSTWVFIDRNSDTFVKISNGIWAPNDGITPNYDTEII
jgi:S-adenosylmethionine/arginine decarboxylase-like enzyme